MAGIGQIKKSVKPRQPKRVEQPQDVWLNEAIDEYLTGKMYPPRGGVFHPSVLSNTCDRYVWLCYHGRMVEQPLPPTLQRIFQNGNFLEKRVEDWFEKMRILLGREVVVKQESPPISGRIDFVIRHNEYGIIPIELKSINMAGFAKLTEPKPEHQVQLQIYLNMAEYEQGTVLYENKNDQRIKSFLVKRDVAQWDSILSRCFRIQEMQEMPVKCTGPTYCACKNVQQDSE